LSEELQNARIMLEQEAQAAGHKPAAPPAAGGPAPPQAPAAPADVARETSTRVGAPSETAAAAVKKSDVPPAQ
jgi:hypothetical protein